VLEALLPLFGDLKRKTIRFPSKRKQISFYLQTMEQQRISPGAEPGTDKPRRKRKGRHAGIGGGAEEQSEQDARAKRATPLLPSFSPPASLGASLVAGAQALPPAAGWPMLGSDSDIDSGSDEDSQWKEKPRKEGKYHQKQLQSQTHQTRVALVPKGKKRNGSSSRSRAKIAPPASPAGGSPAAKSTREKELESENKVLKAKLEELKQSKAHSLLVLDNLMEVKSPGGSFEQALGQGGQGTVERVIWSREFALKVDQFFVHLFPSPLRRVSFPCFQLHVEIPDQNEKHNARGKGGVHA